MTSASHVIKLKLDDALVPNAHVRVDVVGEDERVDASGKPEPKLPKRPAFATGTVPIKILPTTRTLVVSAQAKERTLGPGGTTSIDVEVREPDGRPSQGAEVVLAVADESVLALTGYQTPDPMSVFYAERSPVSYTHLTLPTN